MKNKIKQGILGVGIAFIGLMVFSSCKKKQDTIAKIYILDADNNPVAGATVTLKGMSTITPSPPVNLTKTSTTNASGEAVFNFNDVYQEGQAGVAVLDILASQGTLTGTGIIKIEQEVTSEETVFIHL